MTDKMEKQALLQRIFGYTDFRPGQETLIDGILARRDVFGIMPTGGGKSICYQIPAMLLPGVTLVISPLISLMHDQVTALKTAGIPAAYINSTLSFSQLQAVYRNMCAGKYKLVYVAPERLDAERFVQMAAELTIPFVAVDEAHCISQWGQDFRPSYLRIRQFIDALPQRPAVGAFTATATGQVREDVERLLALKDPVRMVTGFDRPNLFFDVLQPKSKDQELQRLLKAREGKSGIVYCSTRKAVEQVCQNLSGQGWSATRYHAGLEEQERKGNQEDFLYDRKRIMVATNAFGMGIDKSNVSFVIHYNMPKSIESYYQEAGRAGRDGAPADCILLYSGSDVAKARYLIEHSGENEDMTQEQRSLVYAQDLERLDAMIRYCRSTACYRSLLLEYFGEAHTPECGNCGNCRRSFSEVDITQESQMILSCVRRIHDRLGYYVGRSLIVRTLRGSQDQRIRQLGLDRLTTYGLLRAKSASDIQAMVEGLQTMGYLAADNEKQILYPTIQAGEVLYRGKTVYLRVVKEERKPAQASFPSQNDALYDLLRELRGKLARLEGIPAFMIFSNATLTDMARKQPITVSQFKTVSGVGEVKANKYARPFLKVIQDYVFQGREVK